MDFLPLAALLCFFFVALLVRVAVHLRSFGRTGISLGVGDAAFFVLPAGLVVVAFAWAAHAQALQGLFMLRNANPTWLRAVGIAALVLGLAIILVAQIEMGASWRVGIDRSARPGLVTHGLFGWSRNPIYVGMMLGLAAAVALMPVWPTLVIAALALIAVYGQVLREERYLLASYGAEYATYKEEVSRFLPLPKFSRRSEEPG